MRMNESNKYAEKFHSDDRVIFMPLEAIKTIERVIDNLEITRRELREVTEGLVSTVNSLVAYNMELPSTRNK